MTEQTAIDDWRERRDLTLAVKQRVEHQLRALQIELAPEDDPAADQQRRLEDLQFDLALLREAHDEAEQKYLTHSLGSDPTKGEKDNA